MNVYIGNDYDPNCMSTSQPDDSFLYPNGTIELPEEIMREIKVYKKENFKGNQAFGISRTSSLKGMLDFEFFVKEKLQHQGLESPMIGMPMGQPLRLRVRRRMERLLALYASCPIHHRWVDFGVRYYPRWFRDSQCLERESCSIPAGFKCLPSDTSRKIIMYYFCAKEERNEPKCKWIRKQIHIVTACFCAYPKIL